MAEKSFAAEFGSALSKELVGKAVVWGPSIAGAMLLGPVGIFLGLAASAGIVKSVWGNSPSPSGEAPPKD
ncbi:MAG TPA: hypothetical protein VN688_26755 [Gemmataceae bacterium]|nr:hypothetical protein [Gemmataceae bacterium]